MRGLGGGVDQLWGGEERIGSVPERSPGAGDPHVDDLDAGGLGEVPAEQLADLLEGGDETGGAHRQRHVLGERPLEGICGFAVDTDGAGQGHAPDGPVLGGLQNVEQATQ